jgi:hypothetical protein
LDGDQASSGIPATNDLEAHVGISCPNRFGKIAYRLPGQRAVDAGVVVGSSFSVYSDEGVGIVLVPGIYGAL